MIYQTPAHLVQGEGDVGVDPEHLTQGVLVGLGVEVAVEQVLDHVQESWIEVFGVDFA